MEVLCWLDRVWSSKKCVCMSGVISSFRCLRAGSQVFTLLILFPCVILHNMWSGKSMQLLCTYPLVYCFFSSAIRIRFVNILLAVCMLVGIVV